MSRVSQLKTRPDLSPELENTKRRTFEAIIDKFLKSWDDLKIRFNRADSTYQFLDAFFELLTNDVLDYGWLVSYESEEGHYVEDVMLNFKYEDYRAMVDQWATVEEHDTFTRNGLAKFFWNSLAKTIMISLPHTKEEVRSHLKSSLISMFTGEASHGASGFELRYVETDPESGELYATASIYNKPSPMFDF